MKNTSRPPLLPAQREGAAHAQPAVHLCPGRAAPAPPNVERGSPPPVLIGHAASLTPY